jgi:hypothetical protein
MLVCTSVLKYEQDMRITRCVPIMIRTVLAVGCLRMAKQPVAFCTVGG